MATSNRTMNERPITRSNPRTSEIKGHRDYQFPPHCPPSIHPSLELSVSVFVPNCLPSNHNHNQFRIWAMQANTLWESPRMGERVKGLFLFLFVSRFFFFYLSGDCVRFDLFSSQCFNTSNLQKGYLMTTSLVSFFYHLQL